MRTMRTTTTTSFFLKPRRRKLKGNKWECTDQIIEGPFVNVSAAARVRLRPCLPHAERTEQLLKRLSPNGMPGRLTFVWFGRRRLATPTRPWANAPVCRERAPSSLRSTEKSRMMDLMSASAVERSHGRRGRSHPSLRLGCWRQQQQQQNSSARQNRRGSIGWRLLVERPSVR